MAEKLFNRVCRILTEELDTRNSDKKLYRELLRREDKGAITAPFWLTLGRSDLPNIESAGRARRKAQELYPELQAIEPVAVTRELNEEKYREARGLL